MCLSLTLALSLYRTSFFNSCFRAITFTTAYSNKATNTNIKHADIQTSIAFIYDTFGS